MDPDETFNAMLDAQRLGSFDEASEHARNLLEWLNKGGFTPQFRIAAGTREPMGIDGALTKDICVTVCRSVLSKPQTNPLPDLGHP